MTQKKVVKEVQGTELEAIIASCPKINIKAMSPEDKGVMMHSIITMMSQQNSEKEIAWLKLGMIWRFIIKNKLYRHYGDHIRNANDFLRELDLGIKRREIEIYAQLALIFSNYIKARGLDVSIRKLVMIAPLCKNEADAEIITEWVDKAINLPTQALEDEIREAKGRLPRDRCSHPEDKQEMWLRCSMCGKWISPINR